MMPSTMTNYRIPSISTTFCSQPIHKKEWQVTAVVLNLILKELIRVLSCFASLVAHAVKASTMVMLSSKTPPGKSFQSATGV